MWNLSRRRFQIDHCKNQWQLYWKILPLMDRFSSVDASDTVGTFRVRRCRRKSGRSNVESLVQLKVIGKVYEDQLLGRIVNHVRNSKQATEPTENILLLSYPKATNQSIDVFCSVTLRTFIGKMNGNYADRLWSRWIAAVCLAQLIKASWLGLVVMGKPSMRTALVFLKRLYVDGPPSEDPLDGSLWTGTETR